MSEPLEIEVKFAVADPGALRDRLRALGAREEPEVFEENIVLDDARGTMGRRGETLRLRRAAVATLTHKVPVPEGRFKVRLEREVVVDDFHTALAIFEALGFREVLRYQKFRQSFALDAEGDTTLVALDRLPFGIYCEIEGSRDGIEATARQLGLAMDDAIARSYPALASELGGPWTFPPPEPAAS